MCGPGENAACDNCELEMGYRVERIGDEIERYAYASVGLSSIARKSVVLWSIPLGKREPCES